MPPEAGSLQQVRRFPATAVNCFTGSLVKLLARRGTLVNESRLLECGEGYLFRCGLDEWGYPEYTFAVQDVGLLGCSRLGATMVSVPIDGADGLNRLASLCRSNSGAVVWVNTSRLTHDDFYSQNRAYLHALLVTAVSEDGRHVQIHDPLVVNRERYGCETWVDAETFRIALTDQVRTETYNHMGWAHSIADLPTDPGETTATQALAALLRQSERHAEEAALSQAVDRYAHLCAESFEAEPARSRAAARRLFDHINVLYVVPCLTLLGQSLRQAGAGPAVMQYHLALVNHWRAMALLALKFEATLSAAVQARISDRFVEIARTERAMWHAIRQIEHGASPVARMASRRCHEGVAS